MKFLTLLFCITISTRLFCNQELSFVNAEVA